MLNAADFARMRADIQEVISDNAYEISIRRQVDGSETTLDPQTVRVERRSGVLMKQSDGGQEVRGRTVIVGSVDLDIQVADRFNMDGRLYRVTLIRPNRQIATMADLELIE